MEQTLRRVVVTGLGAITPVGNTVEEMWANLKAGVHGIAPITLFDTTDYKTKLGAEVKNFDPRAYMDKTDVLRSDAYAQYGVAAACQAVEESGVIGTLPPERVAVYFGSGIGGIRTFHEEHNKLLARGPKRISPYFIPMLIGNMADGMIAIRFNCRGAALPVVTACATGTNAIGEAMRAIRHGYADAVITGGSEAAISECGVAGFVNMQALSTSEDPEAACLPFDKRRGGFVIGEGGAALVLVVTEPSLSGLSDLQRIVRTASQFRAKLAVCINKYDTNLPNTERIEAYCQAEGLPCLGRIPFDPKAGEAINQGLTVVDMPCVAGEAITAIYEQVVTLMGLNA